MRKYQRFFKDEFDFIPDSYILPEEYKFFCKKFGQSPDKIYLAKPSRGKGGEGIFFVKNKRDVGRDPTRPSDLVVQEYIQNPLVIENKKFDLRIYLLVKGVDKMEAFVAMEGLARFCTEDYEDPKLLLTKTEEEKAPKLFSQLTNFCLNKDNDKFVNNSNFQKKDNGSKRLLSSLFKLFKKQGVDVEAIKEQIRDIGTKIVLAFQPILVNDFHSEIGKNDEVNTNCFHIFGFDILLDENYK